MLRPIPLGIDDFRELREQGREYVDKSLLIQEVLDKGTKVLLLPRPRRFGKTLNLSMLKWFFEKRDEDLSPLFSGLAIAQAGAGYQAHFQRYPVIFLTFKGVKTATFQEAWAAIQQLIQEAFDEHRGILDSDHLSEREAADFQAVLTGTASRALYERALLILSRALSRQFHEKVIILIDEYDQPIHAGGTQGYSEEILDFFRNFLTAGLKGNPFLFKGVLTGILRIAKESIFSGLNNLTVYSLLHPDFSSAFGFTEPEVESLLSRAGRLEQLATVRAWYNGYIFGGSVVYNPWSILNYLDRPGSSPVLGFDQLQ